MNNTGDYPLCREFLDPPMARAGRHCRVLDLCHDQGDIVVHRCARLKILNCHDDGG